MARCVGSKQVLAGEARAGQVEVEATYVSYDILPPMCALRRLQAAQFLGPAGVRSAACYCGPRRPRLRTNLETDPGDQAHHGFEYAGKCLIWP